MAGDTDINLPSQMPGDLVNAISLKLRGKSPHRINTQPETTSEVQSDDDSDGSQPSATVKEEPSSASSVQQAASDPSDILSAQHPEHENGNPTLGQHADVSTIDHGSDDQPSGNLASNFGGAQESDSSGFDLDTDPPEFSNSNTESIRQKKIRVDLPDPQTVQPTFFWTWRLLADGYSIEHLRQVRQIDVKTVFDHVIRAIENDYPVELTWLLPAEKIALIRSFVTEYSSDRPSNLLSKLPSEFAPHELMYFLKCQKTV